MALEAKACLVELLVRLDRLGRGEVAAAQEKCREPAHVLLEQLELLQRRCQALLDLAELGIALRERGGERILLRTARQRAAAEHRYDTGCASQKSEETRDHGGCVSRRQRSLR